MSHNLPFPCILEHWLQHSLRQQVGNRQRDSNMQSPRDQLRLSFYLRLQRLPKREDFISIAIDEFPRVRENQAASGALEEFLLQGFFQQVDLPANRRRLELQNFARSRDRSLARRNPEVQQVVIVHPFHGSLPRGRPKLR